MKRLLILFGLVLTLNINAQFPGYTIKTVLKLNPYERVYYDLELKSYFIEVPLPTEGVPEHLYTRYYYVSDAPSTEAYVVQMAYDISNLESLKKYFRNPDQDYTEVSDLIFVRNDMRHVVKWNDKLCFINMMPEDE